MSQEVSDPKVDWVMANLDLDCFPGQLRQRATSDHLDLAMTPEQLRKNQPGSRTEKIETRTETVVQENEAAAKRIEEIRAKLLLQVTPDQVSKRQKEGLKDSSRLIVSLLDHDEFDAAEKELAKRAQRISTLTKEIAVRVRLQAEHGKLMLVPQPDLDSISEGFRTPWQEAGDAMESALQDDDLRGAQMAWQDLKKARLLMDRAIYSQKVGDIRRDPRRKEFADALTVILTRDAKELGLDPTSSEPLFDQVLMKMQAPTDVPDEEKEREGYELANKLAAIVKGKLDESTYVTAIGVNKPAGPLAPGTTLTMTAEVLPKTAKDPSLTWSVSTPELATIDAKTGVLTPVGAAGGDIEVLATANDGSKVVGRLTVRLLPEAETVEIQSPSAILREYGKLQLAALVVPPAARQAVTWSLKSKSPGISVTREGLVECDGKPAKRTVTIVATAQDGSGVAGEIEFEIRPDFRLDFEDKPFEILGDSEKKLTLFGGAPSGEKLTWQVIPPTLGTVDPQTQVFKPSGTVSGAGRIKVTLEGGTFSGNLNFKVKLPANSVTITAAPAAITLAHEPPVFQAVIDPSNSGLPLVWSVDKPNIATIDQLGKLKVLKAGRVVITATAGTTKVLAKHRLNITAVDETVALGTSKWETVKDMVVSYANKILLTTDRVSKNGRAQYKTYLTALETEYPTKTMQDIREYLLDLRNEHYQLYHSEWLLEAGFAKSTNCGIRNDTTLKLGESSWPIHLTMFFDDGAAIPLGTDFDSLKSQIFKPTDGMGSCHATCVVDPEIKAQIKRYISGQTYHYPNAARVHMQNLFEIAEADNTVEGWLQSKYSEAEGKLRTAWEAVASLS